MFIALICILQANSNWKCPSMKIPGLRTINSVTRKTMKIYHVIEEGYIERYKGVDSLYIVDQNWDDFGYKTRFRLYYVNSKGVRNEIGPVKLTYKGYRADSAMAEYYYRKPADKLVYGELTIYEEYCSLGESLEYYEKMIQYFSENNQYIEILNQLRDVVINTELYTEIKDDKSFNKSLLRESSSNKALAEAKGILFPQLERKTKKGLRFTYSFLAPYVDLDSEPVKIEFDFSENALPYRINVLIGKNGTGKTQLLNALADSLSGVSGEDKNEKCGFVEKRPTIDRVISIAYSAFDDGFKNRESSRDASSVSYVYCGIHSDHGLLSIEELNRNFEDSRQRIINRGRQDKWEEIMKELMEREFEGIIPEIFKKGINSVFMSSGQRILMSTMTETISHIENGSILLIDELELHLHPNAMANTMRMIYKILDLFDSYAIIATHSPLIVQEIPRKYVHVLYRLDNNLFSSSPRMECFGRDISGITDEVFDVLSVESNYKTVLKELSMKYTFEEVLEMFNRKLPLNARMYLSNCYSNTL